MYIYALKKYKLRKLKTNKLKNYIKTFNININIFFKNKNYYELLVLDTSKEGNIYKG